MLGKVRSALRTPVLRSILLNLTLTAAGLSIYVDEETVNALMNNKVDPELVRWISGNPEIDVVVDGKVIIEHQEEIMKVFDKAASAFGRNGQ